MPEKIVPALAVYVLHGEMEGGNEGTERRWLLHLF